MIEWSLRQALQIPDPYIVFDSFQPLDEQLIEQINSKCDFVLSPGCTILELGHNIAYDRFNSIFVKKPCFGAAFMNSALSGRLSKLFHFLAPPSYSARQISSRQPDSRIAQSLSSPIGSRDPFTHITLINKGYDSRLIGCPTLLSAEPISQWRPVRGNRLVVSLSRLAMPTQIALLWSLRREWNVRLLVHNDYERTLTKVLKPWEFLTIVEYESAEQFLLEYKEADAVLTGRLHGALPAIRYGTPVILYGTVRDTRLSLFDYLGLPVYPLCLSLRDCIGSFKSSLPSSRPFDRVWALRQEFFSYASAYEIGVNYRL
ncbi:MAG: polysaccharide pyruvyl transferase family protein [Pirellulaceae bacterium]|nr:polysaccharide pyruvyl transferase family protein [Pirellulaceae bacterium]